jgi:hypothetical protein
MDSFCITHRSARRTASCSHTSGPVLNTQANPFSVAGRVQRRHRSRNTTRRFEFVQSRWIPYSVAFHVSSNDVAMLLCSIVCQLSELQCLNVSACARTHTSCECKTANNINSTSLLTCERYQPGIPIPRPRRMLVHHSSTMSRQTTDPSLSHLLS